MANVLAYLLAKGKIHFQEISDEDWRRLGLELGHWDLFQTEDRVAFETVRFIEETGEGKKVIERLGAIVEFYAFQDNHEPFDVNFSDPATRQMDLLMRFAIIFNPLEALKLEDVLIAEGEQSEDPQEGESG